ncbi:hypothetical protein [Polyangium sp. 15x6]|uniref:hypothetical protein n=1 Tax=Polyangium sp. 15x6 TaxID=3042687 RepID=UPI00249A0A68|nr:hypothetical protein [Polyangium sp. 15x6]MDI3285173.1 hypothetical protein [Polyangium sp. 15x6]
MAEVLVIVLFLGLLGAVASLGFYPGWLWWAALPDLPHLTPVRIVGGPHAGRAAVTLAPPLTAWVTPGFLYVLFLDGCGHARVRRCDVRVDID